MSYITIVIFINDDPFVVAASSSSTAAAATTTTTTTTTARKIGKRLTPDHIQSNAVIITFCVVTTCRVAGFHNSAGLNDGMTDKFKGALNLQE